MEDLPSMDHMVSSGTPEDLAKKLTTSMSEKDLSDLLEQYQDMAFTPHFSALSRQGSRAVELATAAVDVEALSSRLAASPATLRRKLSLAKAAIVIEGEGVSNISGSDQLSRVPPPHMASFSQVAYLGSGRIENPKSEEEIQRLMGVLNAEKANPRDCISITLTLPAAWDGELLLVDSESGGEVAAFRLHRILFCARGALGTRESDCFAFTYAQTLQHPPQDKSEEPKPAGLGFQLHAFRCLVPEAVGRVLICFATAFRRMGPEPSDPLTLPSTSALAKPDAPELDFQFEAFLEIKEEDGKGGWAMSPQEKNCFKLRRGREKRIVVVLQQVSGPRVLVVGKCFGLLLAAGRNVRQSDMHLLDMQSMGRGQTESVYVIEALWDPCASQFEVLNTETPRDTRVFITVAADVVLTGIHDPVRFSIEAKARIFHQHERFWYITRRPVVERYFMTIKKVDKSQVLRSRLIHFKCNAKLFAEEMTAPCINVDNILWVDGDAPRPPGSSALYEMAAFDSATERDRKLSRLALGRSPNRAAQLVHPADDDESDADEPLLSGSGEVKQEWSRESLDEWTTCVAKWRTDDERPKEITSLIKCGVPDSMRGEVWALLSGAFKEKDIQDAYRLLLVKECDQEQVILRDIHRTFPAHDYFKEAGGVGQDALFKISKAYALYDEEVGYCQGLSFLAASLLLHMKEEEGFGVLVRIMFDYGLRELFRPGFEALHLRFYQLERLIEDYIPDLHPHLYDLGVECHMYASQWFLTLFTAKFPLQMVFHIIDLFLCEGMPTIFHISLALLKTGKKELLQLDFEGVLKYFRVSLPRRFRTEATAKDLIQQAIKIKISLKRLTKYEKEYMAMKEREAETQDPAERLERENLRLKDTILRLERENDDLAHELVTSKVELRNALDAAEDSIEGLQAGVEKLTRRCRDLEEENRALLAENEQVKEMCRKELERLENERERGQGIIANYKHICSDLSLRLETAQASHKESHKALLMKVSDCGRCGVLLRGPEPLSPVNGDLASLGEAGRLAEAEANIRHLELQLAQTKLSLVETQCQNQDLSHALASAQSELEGSKKTWFRKTVAAVKEAATLPKDPSRDSNLSSNS